MSVTRKKKIVERFDNAQAAEKKNDYAVASESMSVNDKLKILDEMGRPELIDLFKEWKPRVSRRKQRGAPLDQRVSITVTTRERVSLDNEMKSIRAAGEKVTMSQFIRNRALGSVDINGWREVAERALAEIEDTYRNQSELRAQISGLSALADVEDDADEASLYAEKIDGINRKLKKIVAQNEKRATRLSGRMSMQESETIKWRAQRLCISSSDYLRMMIFGLEPDSAADSHMSYDAKRRFYISIMEVSENGWGTPPTVYECSQCANYVEEIRKLRAEVEQLRQFA